MKLAEHCPKALLIADVGKPGATIPKEILAHVRECKVCKQVLTYYLGVVVAIQSTDRTQFAKCPTYDQMTVFLFGAVGAILRGIVSRESGHNFFAIGRKEIAFFLPLNVHVRSCLVCSDYYEDLYARMLTKQEEYRTILESPETETITVPNEVTRKTLHLTAPLTIVPDKDGKPN